MYILYSGNLWWGKSLGNYRQTKFVYNCYPSQPLLICPLICQTLIPTKYSCYTAVMCDDVLILVTIKLQILKTEQFFSATIKLPLHFNKES